LFLQSLYSRSGTYTIFSLWTIKWKITYICFYFLVNFFNVSNLWIWSK